MDVSEELGSNGLRCRPGDLARVIYSCNPSLIGQVVVVEAWHTELGRWRVCLLSGPNFGVGMLTNRPIYTAHYNFKDSSLEPLTPPHQPESGESEEIQSPFPPSVTPG